MSQQLTISSLFSVLALVSLALFARTAEMAGDHAAPAALVQVEAKTGQDV